MTPQNEQVLSQWICQTWGIQPQNLSLYQKATTIPDYESLEFLGDSLLDFIVADYLMKAFPDKDPGWLTQKRTTLVNEEALASLGSSLGIYHHASLPATSAREHITERVVGDMVEALIAAIYLDQGFEICREVLLKTFSLENIQEEITMTSLDPVGMVQVFLAQRGFPTPQYSLLQMSGPSHDPSFEIEASWSLYTMQIRTKGQGKTKKEATKNAAQKLWQKLDEWDKKNLLPKAKREAEDGESVQQRLHIWLAKHGLPSPLYKIIEQTGEAHCPHFRIEAQCEAKGSLWKAQGQGSTFKEAKQEAAQILWNQIHPQPIT